MRPLLPQEESRQKGLEHLRFPAGDSKTLVLCRPEEVRGGPGVPPQVPQFGGGVSLVPLEALKQPQNARKWGFGG